MSTGSHTAAYRLSPSSRTSGIPSARWWIRWAGALAAFFLLTLGAGLLSAATGLHRLDEALFRELNALGPGPRLLFEILEEPQRNYLLLGSVVLGAAVLTRRQHVVRVLALQLLAAALALGLLNAVYALYDRPRPSEVFDRSTIMLAYGRDWARIESFPSGHMAVVTALAAAAWLVFPRLRLPLTAYVGLNAVTRVLYGAHFPLDVLAGTALGYVSARASFALLAEWSRQNWEGSACEPSPFHRGRLPNRYRGRVPSR